ncbi:MAG TPA: hypothetical protein VFI54_11680 [Solirubrobacteraceae bacterium]|nr:hypothetical protein [Solirubrobacteraceae bacterium]
MDTLARARLVSDEEPFWPAQLAAAAALGLYVTLPHRLIMGPRWLVPGVEGLLLLGLVITTPTRHHTQSARLRAMVVALVGLVSLTTLISLILLARFLLDGSHARGHALLFAGLVLWLTNILIFGIWYWELDRGGPARRVAPDEPVTRADFLFPQMVEPQLAPGWHPGFADYLYTSYTNATAFSPTDTLPLTATAKLLMAIQSLIALITILLVVARAVSVLG